MHSLKKSYQQLGLTLLEIMLVIVVLGFITLNGVNYYARQNKEAIAQRTNTEMQNWLQALASYYIENGRWPVAMKELTDNGEYMLLETRCSLFPKTRFANPGGDAVAQRAGCPGKALYQLACPETGCKRSRNFYMGIKVEVPSEEVGRTITKLLPSSEVFQDSDKRIYAIGYIQIPSVASDTFVQQNVQKGWIVNSGIVWAGFIGKNLGRDKTCFKNDIPLPKCPPGYEGHYILAPMRQTTGQPQGGPGTLNKCSTRTWAAHAFINLGINDLDLTAKEPWVQVSNRRDDDRDLFRYQFYLTFCLPNGRWLPTSTPSKSTSQCNAAWQQYNPGGAKCTAVR